MVAKLPATDKGQLFVASNEINRLRAGNEIARWACENGYRLPYSDRTYAIFKDGAMVREWSLLERARNWFTR